MLREEHLHLYLTHFPCSFEYVYSKRLYFANYRNQFFRSYYVGKQVGGGRKEIKHNFLYKLGTSTVKLLNFLSCSPCLLSLKNYLSLLLQD